jgi:hypothetical protein
MRSKQLLIGVCASLLLTSCGGIEVPEGEQSVQGILQPAPISLDRRGTHELHKNGEVQFYVESKTLSLRMYEGHQVIMKGVFEPNIQKRDLPVLVASEIRDLLSGSSLKMWVLPKISMSLSVPNDWGGKVDEAYGQFTRPRELVASVTVFTQGMDKVSFDDTVSSEDDDTSRVLLTIDGKRAIRITNLDTGMVTLHIDRGGTIKEVHERIITLTFTPLLDAEEDEEKALYRRIEESIRLSAASSSSSAAMSARSSSAGGTSSTDGTSSTGLGQPCGGPAGVLCPAGLYCEVQDFATGVGKCKKL